MGSSIGGKIARGVGGLFTLGLSEAALAGVKSLQKGKATSRLPSPKLPSFDLDDRQPLQRRESTSDVRKRKTILTSPGGLLESNTSSAKRTLFGV